MKNNASSAGKKVSAEKKTADDNNDDPFGALDWKDGIATLPGNVIKKRMSLFAIIPQPCVGCKMIDSQRGPQRRVGCNYLVSNNREWNNCFIKSNHEKSLILSDLVIFSFPPDTHSYRICGAWCNGPYTNQNSTTALPNESVLIITDIMNAIISFPFYKLRHTL